VISSAGAAPPPTRFGVADMLRERNRLFRDEQDGRFVIFPFTCDSGKTQVRRITLLFPCYAKLASQEARYIITC
jgi:hypothetical protein